VIFVLATTEPHRLLPTIVSRCQRFDFRRISLSALVARLRYIADEEGIQVTDRALQFIARTATGSARDAISLLDQMTAYGDDEITIERLRSALGYSDSEIVHWLVAHLGAHEIGPGLNVIQQAVEQGADMRQFAHQVVEYIRGILLARVGGDLSAEASPVDLDEQALARLNDLADRFSVHDLLRAIKLFNQAQLDLRGSDQGQLALELAFVEATVPEPGSTTARPAAGQKQLTEEAPPTVATQAPSRRTEQPNTSTRPRAQPRRGTGTSLPAPAPARASSRVSDVGVEKPASKSGGVADALAPALLQRMQSEISSALRVEGALGRNADGLFRSVFVIGDIQILNGNEIVLGLPPNVLQRVTGDITQIVERVIGKVLARSCSVRFAAKGSLPASGTASPTRLGPDSVTDEGASRPADSMETDAREPESGATATSADERDPYQEAIADPVVQDLISRGGQVTEVQVVSDDE
jgi:hypothetical protein